MVAMEMERGILEEKLTIFGIWLNMKLEEGEVIVKLTWETEKKIVLRK